MLPSFLSSLIPLLALPAVNGLTSDNNIGKLPALGWNSWNAFNCNITEEHFLSAAQKIVDLGLKDAGYEYVNIDDCYSEKERREDHNIYADYNKFPKGIGHTADAIHALGLKFGIYSSAGNYTCAGYPASLGNEERDAATFASWGVDYLKYDNCNVPENWHDECEFCVPDSDNHRPPGSFFPNGTCSNSTGSQCPDDYDWSKSKTAERYRRMRDALQKQNRTIFYSLCEWGEANVHTWGNETGASWRSTGDIMANWPRVLEILNENAKFLDYTDFWGHSDPDMLEVGNGDLTYLEGRSHFALWAAMKSPLLIGTDLTTLSDANVAVLKNKYLLAFNQDDVFGAPAKPFNWDGKFDKDHPPENFAGKFKQGTLVVSLNNSPERAVKTIMWDDVPALSGKKGYKVKEVWSDQDWGCHTGGIAVSVDTHDSVVLVVGSECYASKRDTYGIKSYVV
ncbi:putative alpha-galactosidase B [Tothia fuscella]|uniref:Alpha-galactosidase n=1 Tax=Tothia fuscella TaxID=1048955 RepID=A0A9P4NUN6_9PEZI|nr:putative alpha-galactosidase B [Tothia fuscella]